MDNLVNHYSIGGFFLFFSLAMFISVKDSYKTGVILGRTSIITRKVQNISRDNFKYFNALLLFFSLIGVLTLIIGIRVLFLY